MGNNLSQPNELQRVAARVDRELPALTDGMGTVKKQIIGLAKHVQQLDDTIHKTTNGGSILDRLKDQEKRMVAIETTQREIKSGQDDAAKQGVATHSRLSSQDREIADIKAVQRDICNGQEEAAKQSLLTQERLDSQDKDISKILVGQEEATKQRAATQRTVVIGIGLALVGMFGNPMVTRLINPPTPQVAAKEPETPKQATLTDAQLQQIVNALKPLDRRGPSIQNPQVEREPEQQFFRSEIDRPKPKSKPRSTLLQAKKKEEIAKAHVPTWAFADWPPIMEHKD